MCERAKGVYWPVAYVSVNFECLLCVSHELGCCDWYLCPDECICDKNYDMDIIYMLAPFCNMLFRGFD